MLFKEYEPKVLHKLQRIEVHMLKDFDALCEKYHIDYFACGGTALGGIRHKGFIPWDDDIDLGMTREHYERFLEVAEKEYDGRYKVLNHRTNPDFPVMITKWYRRGTKFMDDDAVTTNVTAGIAIDIFCFDNVADDKKGLRRQAAKAWIYGKLLILRQIDDPTMYAGGWKAKLMLLASKLMSHTLKLFNISSEFLYRKAEEAVLEYRDVETEHVAFLFDPTPFTSVVKRSNIYPTVKKPFEDICLRFPKHTERYLERRYGADYMQLPPEDKRHNHAPQVLEFGEEFADL